MVTESGKRRTQALQSPTQIDVSSDEEPLVRPNFGRHVVARRIIEEDVPSTVPATQVSLGQREKPLFLSSDAIDVEEHRFFSLATDSEDEEGERRTTFDEDSCSDTVSLVGRRNPRPLRLRWSEGSPCRETRVDTPDSHDERSRRAREALQRDSSRPIMGSAGTLRVMCPTEGDSSVRCGTMTLIQKFRQHSLC